MSILSRLDKRIERYIDRFKIYPETFTVSEKDLKKIKKACYEITGISEKEYDNCTKFANNSADFYYQDIKLIIKSKRR